MDPILRWCLRLTQWFRHPPSPGRVMLWITVVAACLVIFGIERIYGWPSWLTLDNGPPRIVRQ